jgi:threonine dehydratase
LFKCENLQRAGAFKFRGACNAVWALPEDEAARGVVTHSSGNHGAALALAARTRGIAAHVVVPRGAVPAKLGGDRCLTAQRCTSARRPWPRAKRWRRKCRPTPARAWCIPSPIRW